MRKIKPRQKAKWGGGHFNALPREFTKSNVLKKLSPHACKLFLDLEAQYEGYNNGDLCIVWNLMRQRGWKSKATLQKATSELLKIELIIRSRLGHRGQCHLYAITLYDIDECKGKMDIKSTSSPPNYWLRHEPAKPIVQPRMSSNLQTYQSVERT